jgi:hypothetical protein
MLGRPKEKRFKLIEPAEVLRVIRDVIVYHIGDQQWIAVDREPAVVGEILMLHVNEGDSRKRLTMCVIESRPVILDGNVRYRIRLQLDELPPILFEQQVRRG